MEALSKSKIKWINSLRLKKNRELESVFVVEGTKMVNELIELWPSLIVLLCTTREDFSSKLPCYFVDDQTMQKMTGLKTKSDVLAVVRVPEIAPKKNGVRLVLDGIQDPGNLGTIIRTADWFGVSEIICSEETVDVYNPKVVQASMGSLFRVKVTYTNLENYLASCELPIYGALLDGRDYREIKLAQDAVLIMGNEGSGISPSLNQYIKNPVFIPKFGEAESLNVAIATGILLGVFNL